MRYLDHPVTRHDLDAVIADRPIAMMAPDHHTVWANTAALEAAGLLHGAAMPAGHVVVMGADGTASGELLEFEAFSPVLALTGDLHLQLGIATGGEPSPWPDAAQRAKDKEKVAAGLAHCAMHGITSMVNMDGNRYTCVLLKEMEEEGRLTARVKVPFHFKPHMEVSELDRASAMAAEFTGDWVTSGFVKMFMDGVVDSRTAYMLHDYPGTSERGAPLFEAEQFKEVCREISRRDLQIAVHAIGDGAVRQTIDGYEAAGRPDTAPPDRAYRADRPFGRAQAGGPGDYRQRAAAASAGGDGFPDVDDGPRLPPGALARCLPDEDPGAITARPWPSPRTGQ